MAKSSGAGKKAQYARYKAQNIFSANRKRKLLKLQKEQPGNTQITEALKNIKYRRKTPNTSQWSHTKIAFAKMKTQYNKKDKLPRPEISEKKMFTLAARAHTVTGEMIWNSF